MRVTSNMMFSAGVGALQTQQQEMMRVQEQSSTGMKINRPSDDPSGAFRHLLFSADLSGVQSLKRTSDLAAQRLFMGDGKIAGMHESMLQAQDLVMRFAHTSVGGDTTLLKNFATDAQALYDTVLLAANSEIDGVPVFGGGRTDAPFDPSHLMATSVRLQPHGEGPLSAAPAWHASSVRVTDEGFQVPFDQEDVVPTDIKISVIAGEYWVDINTVRESSPISVTEDTEEAEETVGTPYLDLGNGLLFDLPKTPREGDTFSFSMVPEGDGFKSSPVEWRGGGGSTSVTVNGEFSTPCEQEEEGPTSYRVSVSGGTYAVDVNGVRQEASPTLTQEQGGVPFLDLGNGVLLNLGATPKDGDVFVFDVEPFDEGPRSTQVRLNRSGEVEDHSEVYAGFVAHVADGATVPDLPLSVKVAYLASSQKYAVNINGIDQEPQKPSEGPPRFLDLGNGVTLDLVGKPSVGDVFYFEVVPAYRGGAEDRPVQITHQKTLMGNVTGAELLEGDGPSGRKINILGALAALRGAMLRTDPTEVAVQLDRIREG